MSLFGQANSAQSSQPAAPGASLFAGFGQPKPAQQQPSTGLFGNTSQPQQLATSLFGNTTSATPAQPQQQQQQTTSLFSNQNPPNQQATAPQANQASNQNGQQAQPSTQQSGAYFDTLLEKSRKRAHGDTTLDELPSLQLGLGDLRERIKRFVPSTADRGTSDGRAHYLLAASGVDPTNALRDLSYFDNQSRKAQPAQPAAQADTDVESYIANLRTQTTLSMIAEGLSRSVRDFDTFLEENTSIEWEAQRKRIYQHFGIKPRTDDPFAKEGASLGRSTGSEGGGFGRSRRSRAGLSIGPKGSQSGFGRSTMHKSVIGSVGPVGSVQRSPFGDSESKSNVFQSNGASSGRTLRLKESKFVEKVQSLNVGRLHKEAYPLLHSFSDVEAQNGGENSDHILAAYNALIEIVEEKPNSRGVSEPNVPKERQFAKAWVEDAPNSSSAIDLRKRILAGAGRYLEKECFQSMQTLLQKNPREANLGGVPNVLSKVKAYVRLRASRKDLAPDATLQTVGDEYIWAIVFYLLRTGHVKEATEYVQANTVLFRAIDRYFFQYLSAYHNSKDKRLPPDLQNRINSEYSQRFRIAPENSIDPFRMACYKVIGRCDLSDMSTPGLRSEMFDWAWLIITLAREVNVVDEYAGAVFTLASVQKHVKDLGEKHSDDKAAKGPLFLLQILCGLFEDAIGSLFASDYCDALHFAIGLDYYGLLRVSDPETSDSGLLSLTTTGRPQVNFAVMVGHYTAGFRAANVVAAVDYITLMCLNGDLAGDVGRRQVQVCHEALRELVLESREFAKLLGDMQLDGQRVKGAIEERIALLQLTDTDDFMRTVTIQAASIADDNGRITDAVLLYDLAEEYDNVITIINRALSDAVATEIGQDQMSVQPSAQSSEQNGGVQSGLSLTSVDNPVKLAQAITKIYVNKPQYRGKITQLNLETCEILLRMNEVKNLVHAQNWAGALDVRKLSSTIGSCANCDEIIASLEILPLEAKGDSNVIRQYSAKHAALPETIKRNVPNLIMWTGESCEQQRLRTAGAQFGANEGTRRLMIEDLKRKAKDLTMYAGFLVYRLPPWVNDMLARIAAE